MTVRNAAEMKNRMKSKTKTKSTEARSAFIVGPARLRVAILQGQPTKRGQVAGV